MGNKAHIISLFHQKIQLINARKCRSYRLFSDKSSVEIFLLKS